MEQDFWLARWRNGEIGFHQPQVDPMLARFWPMLEVESGATVFVPLCGKSLDMRHLAALGHPVLGVDLAEEAAQAYFDEAGEEAVRDDWRGGRRYRSGRTAIHVGDYFALDADALSEVSVVYDRAALVALPPPVRARYVAHARAMLSAGRGVQILLLTIEYDQAAVAGPPHSVDEAEVNQLFEGCEIERLDERPARVLPPKLEGLDVIARVHRIRLP